MKTRLDFSCFLDFFLLYGCPKSRRVACVSSCRPNLFSLPIAGFRHRLLPAMPAQLGFTPPAKSRQKQGARHVLFERFERSNMRLPMMGTLGPERYCSSHGLRSMRCLSNSKNSNSVQERCVRQRIHSLCSRSGCRHQLPGCQRAAGSSAPGRRGFPTRAVEVNAATAKLGPWREITQTGNCFAVELCQQPYKEINCPVKVCAVDDSD